MNLLLLQHTDRQSGDTWVVDDRRARHLRDVLGARPGARVRAGLLGDGRGMAEILEDDGETMRLAFTPKADPPPPLPLILILALPRPKMLKRILIDATSLGIKDIVLLNSYRVDKSYWQTPELKPDLLREKMLLGLEQAGDTRLPRLHQKRFFKPFIEDELDTLASGRRRIIAHPGAQAPCPMDLTEPAILAIGPEGGWIPWEFEQFVERGFEAVRFGERILRVETALPAIVGRLMHLP